MTSFSLKSFDTIPLFAQFGKSPAQMSSYSGPGRAFLPYWGTTYRVCQRYTRSRKAAEERAYEIFVQVTKDSKRNRHVNPLACVYLAAVKHCIRNLRHRKSLNALDLEELDVDTLTILERQCSKNQAKSVLERILSKVRPNTRTVLFLNLLEGLAPEEIARLLNISLLSVLQKIGRFESEMCPVEKNVSGSLSHRWKSLLRRYT